VPSRDHRSGALALASLAAITCVNVLCQPAPVSGPPRISVRNAHSMIYDSDLRKVILFGGADATHVCADTWEWDSEQRQWHYLTGDGPGPRTFAAFAYDERHHEGILFGGNRVLFGSGDANNSFLADTWRFRKGQWTPVEAAGPNERAEAAIAYDRRRARIVMFGGYHRSAHGTQPLGDTWEWDGEQWRKVALDGPIPRNSAAMSYDEQRHRIVLFGGPGPSNETWEWDGRKWTQLQVGNVPGRFNPVMIYDSARKEALRFGGWTGKSRVADTWALRSNSWFFLDIPGPSARNHSAIAYDRLRKRAVLFGGHDGDNVFGDTWEWDGARWNMVASVASEKFVDNGH
jgi:hypothetical protein